MCDSQAIRDMVNVFVAQSKPFTSVDIANEIKRKTLSMSVRNRDVAAWLRINAASDSSMQDYDRVQISVNNGQQTATLYFPHWSDPEDYVSRDQKALGPDDIDDLKRQAKAVSPQVAQTTPVEEDDDDDEEDPQTASSDDRYEDSKIDIVDVFDDGSQYNPDGTGVKIKRKLSSVERLWIPTDIAKAANMLPGDTVDIQRVMIHSGTLNPNLKVHHDGRFAIPRRCVGYNTDPIKVFLKDNKIYFEKA